MESHIFLGINAKDYNGDILEVIPSLYSTSKIHICIMGEGSKRIQNLIPAAKNVETNIAINSLGFNYAYAINVLTKKLLSKVDPNDIVAIMDDWSVFSVNQLIKYEFVDFDFDKNIMTCDLLYDDPQTPIKINTTRLTAAVLIRARKVDGISPTYIPIIITKFNNLINVECGLEEQLFTHASRKHLINQLKKSGLNEVKSAVNKGIYFKYREDIERDNVYLNKELEIVDNFSSHDGYCIFIPSNVNNVWGDVERANNMIRQKDGSWVWLDIKRSPLSKTDKLDAYVDNQDYIIERLASSPEKEETEKEEIEVHSVDLDNIDDLVSIGSEGEEIQEEIEVITVNNCKFKLKEQCLILVDPKIKNIISITPLIKYLYKNECKIDILTSDKTIGEILLLHNFMVRRIFSLNDLRYKNIPMRLYDGCIIKTADCNFKIQESNIYGPCSIQKYLTETNYSIVGSTEDLPLPYCCSTKPKKQLYQFSICISTSIHKNNVTKKKWSKFNTLISKLANEKNINIVLINLNDETKLVKSDQFQMRNNIIMIDNASPVDSAGYIKACDLFITSTYSDLSWVGYGCRKNTLLFESDVEESDIPDCNWVIKKTITESSKFEEIVKFIWSIL